MERVRFKPIADPSIVASTVLLTGAAGIVGTALRPALAEKYERIVLTDRLPVSDLTPKEQFVECDLTDLETLTALCHKVDGVIHLGGLVGADYSFKQVLEPNIVGTYHIFQAAHAAGVTHVAYASSHHAVGFCHRHESIDHLTPHRPDSDYGLSKAFGESAGAYFADNYGLNVLAIRIGFVGPQVTDERRSHTWISARDLAQLIQIGLSSPNLGFEIVYGVSKNAEPFFENHNAKRLGYQPQDSAEEYLSPEASEFHPPDLQTVAGACVGGGFAAVNFAGNTARIVSPPPGNH